MIGIFCLVIMKIYGFISEKHISCVKKENVKKRNLPECFELTLITVPIGLK